MDSVTISVVLKLVSNKHVYSHSHVNAKVTENNITLTVIFIKIVHKLRNKPKSVFKKNLNFTKFYQTYNFEKRN